MSAAAVAHPDLNALPLPDLYRHFASSGLIRRLIELARDEDLGNTESPWRGRARLAHEEPAPGDVTTAACIAPDQMGIANIVARGGGVVAGLAVMPDLLEVFAPGCSFEPSAEDGKHVTPGSLLGTLDEILELERTLLNIVGRLCGVATNTAVHLQAMGEGTRARLYDTRKTTPGLRMLEKYAVRCGGGFCHRIGLYDAVLIKDNHIAGVALPELAAFIAKAADKARSFNAALTFVEVEAGTLEQFQRLLTLPPGTLDIVLLDNMDTTQLREAVALRDTRAPGLRLEASGGVSLTTIRPIALTGVDRISVGALTHSAVALDVALDVVPSR